MNRVIQVWNRIGVWASGVTLFLMMLLTASDVLGRYVFKHPITGVNDMTELMMVIIIFLGLPDTASTDGHIRVEVITSRLTSKTRLILKLFTTVLCCFVGAILAWRMIENARYVYQYPENTLVLEISKLPFILVAALGCSLLTIVLAAIAWDNFKQLWNPPRP